MFENNQINYSQNRENLLKLFPNITNDPELLAQFNADFDSEIEQTKKAIYEVTTKEGDIVGEGEWQINNPTAINIVEISGMPNTGKTEALTSICDQRPFLLYHSEADQLGKYRSKVLAELYSLLGMLYPRHMEQDDRTRSNIEISKQLIHGYLSLYPYTQDHPYHHFFEHGIMDSSLIWPRTRLLDGSVLHYYDLNTDKPRFNVPFSGSPFRDANTAWNLIICLIDPQTSMDREGTTPGMVNNLNTLTILRQQYLRLYYECLQPDSNINVLLLNLEGLNRYQTEQLLEAKIKELFLDSNLSLMVS